MKTPRIIAHRGGRQWAPENTLSAFKKSLQARVDGIELDVHRCASGELIVFHDEELSRCSNGVGLVKDSTYPELKRLSAGLWFDRSFKDEYIPTLQEVLKLIDGQLELNIELKTTPIDYPGIEDDLLELLEEYPARDTLIISSFDHQAMKRLREKAPDLKIALLAAALFIDVGEYANKMRATHFHPALDCIRADAVAEAHNAGLIVNAWTANTPREWRDALEFKVDGIITDDPIGLREFLKKAETTKHAAHC